MKYRTRSPIVAAFILLVVTALACGGSQAAAPATSTPAPKDTPTKTKIPTSTPRPTQTPDAAATKQAEELDLLVKDYAAQGYLAGTKGTTTVLDPFDESWAQIGWFQWWPYDSTGEEFLFKGHFRWSTATERPDESGCGLIFGMQENGDYYAVFVDYKSILFFLKRGANLYKVGKTKGPGKTNFTNPADADIVFAVSDRKAYMSVNDEITTYTLSADQTSAGDFALSMLSGTNKDYGTKCEVTDMLLWKAE